MAIPRTWTAEDISKTGQITITEVAPGTIRFIQPYAFLDINGSPLEVLKDERTMVDVEWVDIPENIRAGLLEIREYLYNLALIKNEMNGGD